MRYRGKEIKGMKESREEVMAQLKSQDDFFLLSYSSTENV